MDKPKVVIEYTKLSAELLDLFDETYPTGVTGKTVRYPNSKGEIVTAVRLETDETSYLVKLSTRAKEILTEEDLDALIRSSTKSKGVDEEEEAEEEEEEEEEDPRKSSIEDED
jgi:Ran GTPase-activating protein (RanGAP) involved in mRNA processing and transport